MSNLPLRLVAICLSAGSLAACASTPPAFQPLGMADAASPPAPAHRFWRNPFLHRAAFERRPVALSSWTPIAEICANPEGRAVLDRDLPGLTERPEYEFFKHMSLRTLKTMSRGRMSDDDVAKVDADLARISSTQRASLP